LPQLDNLMLKGQWPDVSLKMCDFGYSKDESKQSVSKSTCGTPEYMAPEVLFEVRLNHWPPLPCSTCVHGQPQTEKHSSTTCCAVLTSVLAPHNLWRELPTRELPWTCVSYCKAPDCMHH